MTADGQQPTFVEDPFCTGINSYAQVSNNFFEGTRKRQYLTSFLGRDEVLGKVKTRYKADRKACANYVTSEANHAPITHQSRCGHSRFPLLLGCFSEVYFGTHVMKVLLEIQ